MLRHILSISLLTAMVGFSSVARATSLVVPDDSPTVQSAIDSGVDTVLIRSGVYMERPTIDHSLVIAGFPGEPPPHLQGLSVFNHGFVLRPRRLGVSGIKFSGRITLTTDDHRYRSLEVAFSRCVLDSGFTHLFAEDALDINTLTVTNCRLRGTSFARAANVTLYADTVDGGVSFKSDVSVSIEGCWFRGAAVAAAIDIVSDADDLGGAVSNNRIEGYAIGIAARRGNEQVLAANAISNCGTGVFVDDGRFVTIRNNSITGCSQGINAQSCDLVLEDNTVLDSEHVGITIDSPDNLSAYGNIVGRCGGSGIRVDFLLGGHVSIQNNTLFLNGGSGIEVSMPADGALTIQKNIGFQNGLWGASLPEGVTVTLGCNNWFGNTLGPISGANKDPSDLSLNPQFCDIDSADVALLADSPLVNHSVCGTIGALGVGCGVTSTLLQLFHVVVVDLVAVISWSFSDDVSFSDHWAERATFPDGQWNRIKTAPTLNAGMFTVEDPDLSPGAGYSYRICWASESGISCSEESGVSVQPAPRLPIVSPNPSYGAVRLKWRVARTSRVSAEILDVAGRVIVAFPPGSTHRSGWASFDWDGRTTWGSPAAPGWYAVRFQDGNETASRMFLLLR